MCFALIFGSLFTLLSYCYAEQFLENDLAKVCKAADRPVDILFILDGSGSVGSNTFDTQIRALNRVIDSVEVGGQDGTQIAVMQYASYTFVEFLFATHQNKVSMKEAVKQIRHKSGTTKTGKALDKALHLFGNVSTFASQSKRSAQNVAKVAVLVADGYSQDDPIPAAVRLRKAGVHLIVLGIGQHVNMGDLLQITGDKESTFEDISRNESMEQFIEVIRRFAIGEKCEYSLGHDGSEVLCFPNAMEIKVNTQKPFKGLFSVEGAHENTKCKYLPNVNGTSFVAENVTELSFRIPLTECGVQHQFSVNPKGHFFQTTVVLQFHPKFRTSADKTFPLQCFYKDKVEPNDIDWQMVKEHTQRKINNNKKEKNAFCTYRILDEGYEASSKETAQGGLECVESQSSFVLGQRVLHLWTCNQDNYDVYHSMLVHSCFINEPGTGRQEMLIDERGCSLEPSLLETPQYLAHLKALSQGTVFGWPKINQVQMLCSLRFCDRLMGECDDILPPKCSDGSVVVKRQAGFAASIRPLDASGRPTSLNSVNHPLVTFDKSKAYSKRRRGGVDQRVRASISGRREAPRRVIVNKNDTNIEMRLTTQDLKIIEALNGIVEPEPFPTLITLTTTTPRAEQRRETTKIRKEADYDDSSDGGLTTRDPFQQQEENARRNAERTPEESWKTFLELDPLSLGQLSTTELIVKSQKMNVQQQESADQDQRQQCARTKN